MQCRWCRKSLQGRQRSFCSVSCKVTWNVTEWRRRTKKKAVEYLGGQCVRCGYNKCLRSLVFHHRDPAEKEFQIASSHIRGWERIRKELDKCILLCANCHGEQHEDIPR